MSEEIMSEEIVSEKTDGLKKTLRELDSVVVAYSGGVDSSLLLHMAHEVLGDRAVGVLVVSPLIPDDERAEAEVIARKIGAPLAILEIGDLEDPNILANTPERCYFCKASICDLLKAHAAQHGYRAVVDGSNVDDLGDYRPGQRAARECGMRSPLQEAGLTKAEIRTLAREAGLPNWDRPSSACLASRIPYGTPITNKALSQVGEAEGMLRDLGLRQLRVRHHGDVARLEILPEDFDTVLAHRDAIVKALNDLGFTYVTLDLRGFRSGSMNEVIG